MKIKQSFKSYFQIPFTAYIILLSTVLNRLGGFVGPFITLFLADEMGFSGTTTGFVVAINASVGMLGILIGGKVVDTIGSKYTRIIFHGLHGIIYILCVYTPSAWVIPLLALASFSSGIQGPSGSTMLMENTEEDHRKSAFSLNYVAINVGFTFGPLIAAFLYKNYLDWLFIGDGISSFLSIFLILIFVPNRKPSQLHSKRNATEGKRSTMSILKEHPNLIKFLITIVLLFVAFSQSGFAVPLTAIHVLGETGVEVYAAMMFLNGLLCTVMTPFITMMTKHTKPATALAWNGILYTLGFGMFAFVKSPALFLLATFIWTTGEILGATNTDVYIASHAPATHRGRINALPSLMRRAGFIISPLLAGFIKDLFGILFVWYVVAAFALMGTLLILTSQKENILEHQETQENIS